MEIDDENDLNEKDNNETIEENYCYMCKKELLNEDEYVFKIFFYCFYYCLFAAFTNYLYFIDINIHNAYFSYEFHNDLYHNNECLTCKKKYLTIKMLDIHNLEIHDTLYQLKLERNEEFYRCFVDDCDFKCNKKRERFNHIIAMHNYQKNDLIKFDFLMNEDNFEDSNDKKLSLLPKKVCFGEDAELAFESPKIKTAKRKIK